MRCYKFLQLSKEVPALHLAEYQFCTSNSLYEWIYVGISFREFFRILWTHRSSYFVAFWRTEFISTGTLFLLAEPDDSAHSKVGKFMS